MLAVGRGRGDGTRQIRDGIALTCRFAGTIALRPLDSGECARLLSSRRERERLPPALERQRLNTACLRQAPHCSPAGTCLCSLLSSRGERDLWSGGAGYGLRETSARRSALTARRSVRATLAPHCSPDEVELLSSWLIVNSHSRSRVDDAALHDAKAQAPVGRNGGTITSP